MSAGGPAGSSAPARMQITHSNKGAQIQPARMTQFLTNGHIPTTNHPRGDALQVGIEAGTGQQVGVASAPNPSRLGTIFSHKPEYSHMPAATQSFLTLKEQCYLLASKQVALLGIQRPGMHNQYAS